MKNVAFISIAIILLFGRPGGDEQVYVILSKLTFLDLLDSRGLFDNHLPNIAMSYVI